MSSRQQRRLVAISPRFIPARLFPLLLPLLLMAALLMAVLATWSLAIARYGGPDEPGHVLRAASVARGELLGDRVPGLVGGFRAVTVPAPLTTGDPRCFRHDKRLPATCAVATSGGPEPGRAASSVGTYPPWYYALVGLPVRAFTDPSVVNAYRLVAAALCALVLAVALARARQMGRRNALFVLAALAPPTWFLFGVVNPNSLEIALTALAWIGVERIRASTEIAVGDLSWVALPAAVAIVIRPIAAVAVGTMMFVLWVMRRTRGSISIRQWARLLVWPAVAVVASVGWSAWSSVSVSDVRDASHLSLPHRFWEAILDTADTVHEAGGSLGWLEFSAPGFVQIVWWAGVLACGYVAVRSTAATRAGWLSIAASAVLFPIAFETALAGRIGFIWQGRYTLPTAVGLVIIGSSTWTRAMPRRSVGVLAGLVAVVEVATFWTALRRYTVGTNGSWLFRNARWDPPVAPLALLALNAVAIGALIVACCVVADPAPRNDRRYADGEVANDALKC